MQNKTSKFVKRVLICKKPCDFCKSYYLERVIEGISFYYMPVLCKIDEYIWIYCSKCGEIRDESLASE